MEQLEFMDIKDILIKKPAQINLRGWVYRKRDQKDIIFISIRDHSGVIQLVVDNSKVSKEIFENAKKLTIESSFKIKGVLRKEQRAPEGYEIDIIDLEIINIAENYPISKDFSEEFLLDVRHLWLRSRKMNAILKIRSCVFKAVRDFFIENKFYEYHSPILQSVNCEGGSTLFEVPYFEKKGVFLSQTWQLYAEPAIFSLGKIFSIEPAFRAEKSKTTRHLTELWMAEMEGAFINFEELQNYGEKLIKRILKEVLDKHKEELKILKRDISILESSLEKPFVRMTYDESLNILKEKFDFNIEWGKDLRTIEEDKLSKLYDTFIIITHYPKKVKAFYMKEDPKNPEVVLGFDCIGPEGYGEIIGASERESDINKIKKNLLEQGEDISQYDFYLDTRRYGSVPHSGFGMGMERIISFIIGADTIKDAIAFPRTMVRYKP
ncbi:MAG: asparagine--tRNA ligase [Candidatus ainarchaeum sp.]|nr:asparagine--tRNA ligase [Candidatus ainarchaeum sp.]MDD3975828.1 asparagine--tRNA ligase [Candidatus ainarchaeum sp.]